jgi:glutamate dehydrogenase
MDDDLPLRTQLAAAFLNEGEKFKQYYHWLESAMPPLFFEEVSQSTVMLIVHNLMEFDLQGFFSGIHLKHAAIVMCLDTADADLKILKDYATRGVKYYQTYTSKTPPPFLGVDKNLRIGVIHFSGGADTWEKLYPTAQKTALQEHVTHYNRLIAGDDFEALLYAISPRFLLSLPIEKRALVLELVYRAQQTDHCQYDLHRNENWEARHEASMQVTIAWRNTPKHNFIYRLAHVIHRHGLVIKRISASYSNPYSTNSILAMAFDLHGIDGRAAWEVADIPDFLKELVTVKFFASFDAIEQSLVTPGIISGNMGNLLRAMKNFIHQALVHIDANLYNVDHITEGLCRHPELTEQLCEAFAYKFDPELHDEAKYQAVREYFFKDIEKLDTGHEENDIRRKNILKQGMNFVHYTLKTNFYRPSYSALSFRVDSKYLEEIPFDLTKKFPEIPYALFFIKGMHFFGFHIRFRDLARGGLRTVFPEHLERMLVEQNTVFTECYNLALTQHMKNKDIPEAGSKAVIFLIPYERLESEATILQEELEDDELDPNEIEQQLNHFRYEQKMEHLYQAQRAFVENLVTLVNCDSAGKLKAKGILDYWNKPEYIYLGPDENMYDDMIQWIADYSKNVGYKPGSYFITGRVRGGINHKEYGVTSLGVNVYMEAVLKHLGIDPTKDRFTVKMSGGPDGDVAGNQINNLHRYYPYTAKLLVLTDVSGTIYDPEGLDLNSLVELFHRRQPIKFYPAEKLNDGGFLVDKLTNRYQTPFVQQTLCWRKLHGKLHEDWLSGSDMNHVWRYNVLKTPADIFIPSGGRPRTLNATNYKDYLDDTGKPTSRAIIEGANLYLDTAARRALEKLGVLIVKDSSANKTGVICSSFEVLSGLTLGEEKFIEHKDELVKEILCRLKQCAANEADLLLRTYNETQEYLTDISDKISKRINQFTDQILDYLDKTPLSEDPNDPLMRSYLGYCLPLLRKQFQTELLHEIPDPHKKAIIACHIASSLVYKRGLAWFPSVVDVLPVILEEEPELRG